MLLWSSRPHCHHMQTRCHALTVDQAMSNSPVPPKISVRSFCHLQTQHANVSLPLPSMPHSANNNSCYLDMHRSVGSLPPRVLTWVDETRPPRSVG